LVAALAVEVDPNGEQVRAHEANDGRNRRRHRALARSWVVVRYDVGGSGAPPAADPGVRGGPSSGLSSGVLRKVETRRRFIP
jgi:hypothetical protein